MNASRTARTGTIATLALALTLTLTACGTAGQTPAAQETTPAATTAPVETPPAVETPAVVTPVAGATITSDEEQAAAEAAGLGVFDVFDTDGNYVNSVVFDKAQPLPEPVKAAIAAPVTAAFDAATATGISGDEWTNEQNAAAGAVFSKATARAKTAGADTGRTVIVVFPRYTGEGVHWGAVMADNVVVPDSSTASQADSLAITQAWVAAQPNPETFEIVIAG